MAISICIVLILVLIYILWNNWGSNEFFLQGFWEADENFCQDSGLGGMVVSIGPENSGIRKIYIILHNFDSTLINRTVEARLYSNLNLFGLDFSNFLSRNLETMTLEFVEEEIGIPIKIQEIFPGPLEVTVDRKSGRMEWKSEDRIYARLYKNFIQSEVFNQEKSNIDTAEEK